MTVRLYFSDWQVLALIKLRGYGYNADIAQALKKTRRAISYTLSKLSALGLLERCGNPKCPFQWFQINPQQKEQAGAFIKYLGTLFSLKKFKKNCCFFFDQKDFYVLQQRFTDVARPLGFSIGYTEIAFFRKLYKDLRKMHPYIRPMRPPNVLIQRKGKGTFHISLFEENPLYRHATGKILAWHYWARMGSHF